MSNGEQGVPGGRQARAFTLILFQGKELFFQSTPAGVGEAVLFSGYPEYRRNIAEQEKYMGNADRRLYIFAGEIFSVGLDEGILFFRH